MPNWLLSFGGGNHERKIEREEGQGKEEKEREDKGITLYSFFRRLFIFTS